MAEWAEKVRARGIEQGRFFMVRALAYFASQFFDINGEEYPVVKSHLQAVFADELQAA